MRSYMTTDQSEAMARVRFLKAEVSTCDFHADPCPLLIAQLDEAQVLVSRLSQALHAAREKLKKDSE